jgi:hypothetical protein
VETTVFATFTTLATLIGLAGISGDARADLPPSSGAPPPSVVGQAPPEQPRTLLASPITSGGFGAPSVSYTQVAGDDSVLVGARGGWIINHQFVLGGGGFGLANRIAPPSGLMPNPDDYRLNFGYGGLWVEYLIAPMEVVHGSVGTLVGGGALSVDAQREGVSPRNAASDSLFVLDPAAAVEVSVSRLVRVGLEARYRIVRGVDLAGLGDSDLSGFALGTVVKIGVF